MEQKHLLGMWYLTAIKCNFSEQQSTINYLVDTCHPRKTEIYYLPQVGTQCDVISKKGIMHHSFRAVNTASYGWWSNV